MHPPFSQAAGMTHDVIGAAIEVVILPGSTKNQTTEQTENLARPMAATE